MKNLTPGEVDALHEVLTWSRIGCLLHIRCVLLILMWAPAARRFCESTPKYAPPRRTGTNNKVLRLYSTIFENFNAAVGTLMSKIRSVLPEGSTACRIRASARETHQPRVGTIQDTLGEESCGMVFLDPTGVPLKYDQLQVLKEMVGVSARRIEIDAGGKAPNTWRTTGQSLNIAGDPSLNNAAWRRDISLGADHILEQRFVSATDAHLDAKIWPHMRRP